MATVLVLECGLSFVFWPKTENLPVKPIFRHFLVPKYGIFTFFVMNSIEKAIFLSKYAETVSFSRPSFIRNNGPYENFARPKSEHILN